MSEVTTVVPTLLPGDFLPTVLAVHTLTFLSITDICSSRAVSKRFFVGGLCTQALRQTTRISRLFGRTMLHVLDEVLTHCSRLEKIDEVACRKWLFEPQGIQVR